MEIASRAAANKWGVEPVVVHSLVSIQNDRVTLTRKHLERIRGERLDRLAIDLDDGEGMLVERDREHISRGLIDDAEAVALPALDVDDGPRDLRTSLVATDTVDCTGIGHTVGTVSA